MHDAEIHVFSDAVLSMGKQAMNEPEINFTRRWNDYLEQYRKSARKIDGEKIQFIFHMLPGAKTNDIVLEIDEWIRQSQGEDGQNFTPETCPHRVLLKVMMNEIPISSKEPKGGKAQFLQDSGSSSLDTSCTLVQDRKRLTTLKSIQMTQKENCMCLAKHVTELYLVQKHLLLRRMCRFPERRNEEKRCKHAFQRRWCICNDDDGSHQFSQRHLYCFRNMWLSWKALWDRRWKSTKFGFGCSLLQVSENVTQSRPRPFAAENVWSCAPIAEGNLLARETS